MRVDLTGKLILENKPLSVGQKAPDFYLAKLTERVIDDVTLNDFKGKVKMLACFPSIDTGVCDAQTKKLHQDFKNIDNLVIINVSTDFLFAFNRWCGANDMKNMIMLSDYRDHQFAKDYGINVQGANVIYRSVFILDENNIIKYIQLAKGISTDLDFEAITKALKSIL